MAVTAQQLRPFLSDYGDVTGARTDLFVCPITLLPTTTKDLVEGHVLNKSVLNACRVTIPQRADVDHHFGGTIEAEFINFVNIPHLSNEERFGMMRQLTIRHESIGESRAFFANSSARERFQQIELIDSRGDVVARPFLTEAVLSGPVKSMEVEWTVTFQRSAITGTIIKSAFLALFRMLGYRWVLGLSGDYIRRALFGFVTHGKHKRDACHHFGDFDGCLNLLLDEQVKDLPDTLADNVVLLHSIPERHAGSLLFAVSCIFRLNGYLIVVTLPFHKETSEYLAAYATYRIWLRDRSFRYKTHAAKFLGDQWHLDPREINFKYQA